MSFGKRTASQKTYGIAYSLFCMLAPLSFVLFVTGDVYVDLNIMLAGATCLYLANVIYALLDIRNRMLFLFLHLGLALFQFTRPWIALIVPTRQWMLSSVETTVFALTALYLSMAFLLLGTVFCCAISSGNTIARTHVRKWAPRMVRETDSVGYDQQCQAERTREQDAAAGAVETFGAVKRYALPAIASVSRVEQVKRDPSPFRGIRNTVTGFRKLSRDEKWGIIRTAAFVCFLVCVAGSLLAGAIKLSYMSGRAYTDYYLTESSDYIPWALDLLDVMAPYVMCAFLATMPRRRTSCICLLLYLMTTVPMLIIGSRSNFAIAFCFAALYFVFRYVTDKREKWISRRLVIFCAIALPFGVVAMGLMNYLRANEFVALDFVGLFLDSLYKQGVSFTVLGKAYDVNPQVQALGFRFFSIGRLIDTFTQGFIGQTFFGFTLLPHTNSVELATQGWSYAHTMSFFAHSNYLGGEGYGSSYILETFADFGYAGIAGGSFAIACGLFMFSHALGRSWFWGMCALISSLSVFHMPRGYADEWFAFLVTTRFWLAVVLVMAVSAIFAFVSTHVRDRDGVCLQLPRFQFDWAQKVHTQKNTPTCIKAPDKNKVLLHSPCVIARKDPVVFVDKQGCLRNKYGVALVEGANAREIRKGKHV